MRAELRQGRDLKLRFKLHFWVWVVLTCSGASHPWTNVEQPIELSLKARLQCVIVSDKQRLGFVVVLKKTDNYRMILLWQSLHMLLIYLVVFSLLLCTVIRLSFMSTCRLVWESDWRLCLLTQQVVLCVSSWSVGGWGVCSRSCGGGEHTRLVQCVQRISQTNADTLADSHCAQPTPVRRQACNTLSCPPVWTSGPWSQVGMCHI